MKKPDQVLVDVRRRLGNTWHLEVALPANDHREHTQRPAWPHSFPIGTVAKADLESRFEHHQRVALTWRTWASAHDLTLTDTPRMVHGTSQRIPTHVTVPSVDVAARLCGPDWIARLERGRFRAAELHRRFPAVLDLPRVTKDVDPYSDTDFALLCSAADWFRRYTATGLTPRQVPVPGLHAKWLNTRQAIVATLAGVPTLGLLPRHPARLHFTYLDPHHRASGGRWHDSATVGDAMIPAYSPTVAVISENKDTALHFPELDGGVSVEGMGHGGATAAAFPWLRQCPNLFYWGDMDAAGFEILNGFREAGLAVTSVLMDLPTYERYEQFGTPIDRRGQPIAATLPRQLPHLTTFERQLYECLTDPAWRRYRRVEQERIPLNEALDAVRNLSSFTPVPAPPPRL